MIAQYARPAYDQRKWAIKKIHVVAARMKIDDQSRRAWQQDLVGVASCADMDGRQLLKVLYVLTHHTKAEKPRGSTSSPRTEGLTPIGDVVGKAKEYILRRAGRDERMPDEPITVEQQRMLEHLFADIETINPGRLARTWRTALCKRQCGRVWPQNRADANRVIECLKAMRTRGWHPKEAARV